MREIESIIRRIAIKAGVDPDEAMLLADDPDDHAEAQERIRRLRHEAFLESLPEAYLEMTFSAWKRRVHLADAYKTVKAWADAVPDVPAGLFLYGQERGTGKTHLAIAAATVCSEKGLRVTFVDVVSLLSRIRNGFDKEHPRVDVEGIGRYCDVLVLDDMGAEKPSRWVDEQFYLLVNTAVSRGTHLIVTSNLDYGLLAERMDDRIVSRLVGATDRVLFDASDYRNEQHKRRAKADA